MGEERDLYKENEDLLLKLDGLVGEKKFDELEEIGYDLLNREEHPSLIMSFHVYRFSWPISEELQSKIKERLDSFKNE